MNIEIQSKSAVEEKIKKGFSSQELEELLVAYAYEKGVLTSKEACEIINTTRIEFENILPKYGFSIMRDTDQNLQVELDAYTHYKKNGKEQ